MSSPAAERAAEAAAEKEAVSAEVQKHSGWGVREILHWLIDQVSVPHYARAGAPSAEVVHAVVDKTYGYVAPEPALSAQEEQHLNALLAKQREFDAAKAAAAAGVEQHNDVG